MITLKVLAGPGKGHKHQLADDRPLLIGRRHGDVPLDDRAVSKEHARIEPGPLGGWIVRDLGSANGTWVNGQRIDGTADLTVGDKLQIGRSVLVYKQAAGAAPGIAADTVLAPGGGSGTGLHHHASDDTHHNAETLHHALQLQQAHGQALEQIRQQLESVAEQLSQSQHAASPATDDWAASARSAIAAEIGSAVAELGRRLDAIEKRVQQAADTAKAEAAKAPAPVAPAPDPQLTAAVADLRQSMQTLPAQLDARPALQQVLAAVERLTPADHAGDLAAMREAIAAAADQSQQRALLEQVLAAVTNLKLPEMPAIPAIPAMPDVPDHRAELASLREAIATLPSHMPQPNDHAAQLAAIQAALADASRHAAIEQKLAELAEAVRFAGDHRAVLDAISAVPAAIPGPPQPVDHTEQLQQVLDAVASLKDPTLAAGLDELLARPAAEQGVCEALQLLRSAIESAPRPIDPTPALMQQVAELREALTARIDAAAAASSADQPLLAQILETVTAPQPPRTDPALVAQLDAMQEKIAGLPAVDVAPLEAQVAQLASYLDTLKPLPDPRLDDLLKAVDAVRTTVAAHKPAESPLIDIAPLQQKLEAIETALAQRDTDNELAALLAAAQEQAAAAARTDSLLETMLAELGDKLDTLRPDATQHTLNQVLTELRNRPDPDVAVRTALVELRTTIEQRVTSGGVVDDAAAKQAALAAAQASIRPVIDMLHEIATEMSHWPKRQERVLGELYAAMRDLQLQQEQHEDRLLRLADHIGAADRPRRASAMAASSRSEFEELTDYADTMPQPVAIDRRQPSAILTVAVVFFIVVMTFMAIAGTTQWL